MPSWTWRYHLWTRFWFAEFAKRMSQIVAVSFCHVTKNVKCAPTHLKTGKKCFSLLHFELLMSFIIIISFIILILPLLLSLFFWQNKTFIGVNCGTNDAKVTILSSIISGGKRTYKCFCEGTLSLEVIKLYCYMHY